MSPKSGRRSEEHVLKLIVLPGKLVRLPKCAEIVLSTFLGVLGYIFVIHI